VDAPITSSSGDGGILTSMPPPAESSDFRQLGTPESIVKILRAQHITTPTAVQVATLPDAFSGKDVLAQAPTGSGKTLAFGIPLVALLSNAAPALPGHPRALIISPTRELADQIADVLADLGAAAGLRVLSLVGGDRVAKQQTLLAAPVDIAVVTPGRAHDLRRRGLLSLDQVHAVVVDEADMLADLGFLPDVLGLVRACPKSAQRMVFSATLNDDAAGLIRDRRTGDTKVARHKVTSSRLTMHNMRHLLLRVSDNDEADEVIAWIASRKNQCVIFANSKARVVQLAKFLQFYDIRMGFLHGDRGQATRRAVLKAFADGELDVLVTTDVAARGIDINSLDLVVHADPPTDAATYIHRSGRTARAGASGTVAMVVRDRQVDQVREMLKQAGVHAEELRAGPGLPRFVKELGARRPRRARRELNQDVGCSGSRGARGAAGAGYRGRGPSSSGKGRTGGRVHRPKRGKKKKR
jgi:superfamily II DNA/RNA helicase